jgi:hypothetical protein
MPCLQERFAMLGHDALDRAEFAGSEALTVGQAHGIEPELRLIIIPLYMHVRRLDAVLT